MIAWNPTEIAEFLGSQPEQPHAEATEFIFRFTVSGNRAQLHVYPFSDDVWLRLFGESPSQPFAEWRIVCRAIRVEHDDEATDEEESVAGLCFYGQPPGDSRTARYPASHWIMIAPLADSFRIGTFYSVSYEYEAKA